MRDDVPGERGRAAGLIGDFAQDLRFAVRGLFRDRGFTLLAALTIAIGVGATTAVVSIANAVLLRAPPVSEPERLVSVWESRTGSVATSLEGMMMPYGRYQAYEAATRDVFAGMAAHRYAGFALRTDGDTRPVNGVLATGNYFSVLGAQPAVGRFFTADDEPAVVLGHGLWLQRFGGDPGAVGRTVWVDSRPFVIAGVAPPEFGGTAFPLVAELWVPFGAYQAATPLTGHSAWLVPIGRLRPGIERTQAQAVVDVVAKRIPPDEPQTTVRGARLDALTLRSDFLPWLRAFLAMLLATGLLVLLIASANIAGMLLARAFGRRREVAVRLAIGAGRGRLVRQLLTETLVLFLVGGAAGVLFAVWATRLVTAIRIPVNAGEVGFDASPDARVLAFGLALAALTGILFGLGPAMRASRLDLATTIKDGPSAAGGRVRRRRSAFVTAQLALAVLLLVTAGLFVRTVQQGLDVDPGFDPAGVVIAAANLEPHDYDEARGRAFFERLQEQVGADASVERVALARLALLAGESSGNDVEQADPGEAGPTRITAAWNVVDTAYLATLDIALVAGRGFTAQDRAGGAPVVIVNETLARRLWPGENAIGKRLREGRNVYEVVGVARDGKYIYLAEAPMSFAFLPYAQHFRARMTLHIRTASGLAETRALVERTARALDANVAVEARALDRAVEVSLFPQRFGAILTAVFGLVGLLLAAIGVYGVLAMHVAQRRREFGIRLALGARRGDVLRLVLGRGVILALAGAAIGLALAAGVTRTLRSFLFGVSPLDPVTFATVAGLLVVVAALASFVPARRATRSDPLETLRQE